jgi:hypothetical protein
MKDIVTYQTTARQRPQHTRPTVQDQCFCGLRTVTMERERSLRMRGDVTQQ